jgi:hypothetical protein
VSDDDGQREFFERARAIIAHINKAIVGEGVNVAAFALAYATCYLVEGVSEKNRDEARFYASKGSALGVSNSVDGSIGQGTVH